MVAAGELVIPGLLAAGEASGEAAGAVGSGWLGDQVPGGQRLQVAAQ